MFWIVLAAVAGYIAAIFTWPQIRIWAADVAGKIASLRDEVRALGGRIKTLIGR